MRNIQIGQGGTFLRRTFQFSFLFFFFKCAHCNERECVPSISFLKAERVGKDFISGYLGGCVFIDRHLCIKHAYFIKRLEISKIKQGGYKHYNSLKIKLKP